MVGTEIWLRDQRDEEKILAEGVTKIEFREGEIIFQTVLGEEIRVKADIQRSLLTEQGFIFEVACLDPSALPQRIVPVQPEATEVSR
ncbi:MAG: CooT family nickel-binding protein [Nitrospirae bacterium]|nr:CooT family nickel-binding protein [Candidatus Manganitrophaceae bacterium]